MNVRYRVTLTQCERDELWALLSGGKHPARRLKRAQILLAADSGVSDEDIAAGIGVGGSTVYRTKRRFVESNLDLALSEEPRPGAERKLTGKEDDGPSHRWTPLIRSVERERCLDDQNEAGVRSRIQTRGRCAA
jgi:Winged helix-turn helix